MAQYNDVSFGHVIDVLHGSANSQFPNGSINVKSAWVEMQDLDSTRFYTRDAWVRRSPTNCEKTKVGLVGLHVVQKTPTRARWIWSTFEHVDNAPDDDGIACVPPVPLHTFHDTRCRGLPDSPPTDNDPYAPPQDVFNVVRTFAFIGTSTNGTNKKYRAKFARRSVWKNYELVMTQWPVGDPPTTDQGGIPKYTFPGSGAETAFANTVMETFFQTKIELGCMGCHGQVAATDFVWSLQIEPPATRGNALRKLRKTILQSGIRLQ